MGLNFEIVEEYEVDGGDGYVICTTAPQVAFINLFYISKIDEVRLYWHDDSRIARGVRWHRYTFINIIHVDIFKKVVEETVQNNTENTHDDIINSSTEEFEFGLPLTMITDMSNAPTPAASKYKPPVCSSHHRPSAPIKLQASFWRTNLFPC